jgi:Fe-Mn family superoxide dismutase
MDRREMLGVVAGAAVAGAITATGRRALADDKPPALGLAKAATRKPGAPHEVVPLPFEPSKLRGISEKLILSHHGNNYASAVKNLSKVEADLAATTKDTPAYVVNGLRERELTFANSKTLHELYFGTLGGDGKAPDGVQRTIGATFGSFGRWEELFRGAAMGLAGGSGWVVLGWSFHLGELRIAWSGGHTQAMAAGTPILVLDMYEHAYQMDYGAAAAKYVDAWFGNVQWDEVARRWERVQKAHAALRA